MDGTSGFWTGLDEGGGVPKCAGGAACWGMGVAFLGGDGDIC